MVLKKDNLNSFSKIDFINRIIELEQDRENNITKNCNTIIISNSITLIPLLYVFIEVLKEIPQVRLLTIIFGLILVGLLLVGSFLSILANQLYRTININIDNLENDDYDLFIDQSIKELNNIYEKKCKNNSKRNHLLLSSQMCSYAFFVLLAAFILVIMIMM